MLPTDAQERKRIPVYSGFLAYFPDAIIEVTKVSVRGNEQHNPGSPLYWDRSKSGDELDALARHLIGSAYPNSLDERIDEAAARTWRSLADLQKLCEIRDQNPELPKIAPQTLVDCETEEDVHEYMRRRRLIDDAELPLADELRSRIAERDGT